MVKEAITHYENAISIARETGDDFDLASHLQNLGTTLLSESKDLPRAERLLHEALAAAERSQNADVVLGCFSALGNLHRAVGSLNEAARLYAGALEAARLSGERLGEGNNLSNLGLVMCELGDVEEGERMLREALAIAVEIGDRRGEGNRTGHIGGILIEKARRFLQGLEQSRVLESAREHVSAAILIAAETGDSEKLGTWLMNLGIICALEGNLDEGIKQYEKALALAKTSGLARLEAQARFNLGSSFARRGQFERALGHFHISGALARKMGSPMALQARVYVSRLTKMLKQWLNRFFRG
jgi:tetratricopeptide (TPR) repeat protein